MPCPCPRRGLVDHFVSQQPLDHCSNLSDLVATYRFSRMAAPGGYGQHNGFAIEQRASVHWRGSAIPNPLRRQSSLNPPALPQTPANHPREVAVQAAKPEQGWQHLLWLDQASASAKLIVM